jgi:hypothetical protein
MDREERVQLLMMLIPSLLLLALAVFLMVLPDEEPAPAATPPSARHGKFDPHLPAGKPRREPVGIHGYQVPQGEVLAVGREDIDDPAARLGFGEELLPQRPL